jgi:hypothetical protein
MKWAVVGTCCGTFVEHVPQMFRFKLATYWQLFCFFVANVDGNISATSRQHLSNISATHVQLLCPFMSELLLWLK